MEEFIQCTNDKAIYKKILTEGKGTAPKVGQKVKVKYTGMLEEGTKFDESKEPIVFKLGGGEVVKGWEIGIPTMKKGERSVFVIRYDYAYGEQGYPGLIPPKSTLIYLLELIDF